MMKLTLSDKRKFGIDDVEHSASGLTILTDVATMENRFPFNVVHKEKYFVRTYLYSYELHSSSPKGFLKNRRRQVER